MTDNTKVDSNTACTCNEPYGDFICSLHNVNVHTGDPTPTTPSSNTEELEEIIKTVKSKERMILYTDVIGWQGNKKASERDQTSRDDLWAISTEELALITTTVEKAKATSLLEGIEIGESNVINELDHHFTGRKKTFRYEDLTKLKANHRGES